MHLEGLTISIWYHAPSFKSKNNSTSHYFISILARLITFPNPGTLIGEWAQSWYSTLFITSLPSLTHVVWMLRIQEDAIILCPMSHQAYGIYLLSTYCKAYPPFPTQHKHSVRDTLFQRSTSNEGASLPSCYPPPNWLSMTFLQTISCSWLMFSGWLISWSGKAMIQNSHSVELARGRGCWTWGPMESQMHWKQPERCSNLNNRTWNKTPWYRLLMSISPSYKNDVILHYWSVDCTNMDLLQSRV